MNDNSIGIHHPRLSVSSHCTSVTQQPSTTTTTVTSTHHHHHLHGMTSTKPPATPYMMSPPTTTTTSAASVSPSIGERGGRGLAIPPLPLHPFPRLMDASTLLAAQQVHQFQFEPLNIYLIHFLIYSLYLIEIVCLFVK